MREEEKDYTINLDDTTFKSPMIPKKSPNFLQEDYVEKIPDLSLEEGNEDINNLNFDPQKDFSINLLEKTQQKPPHKSSEEDLKSYSEEEIFEINKLKVKLH